MRKVSAIYDELNVIKSSMTELNSYVTDVTGSPVDDSTQFIIDAKSTSKIARWRLWLWIVAFAIWILEAKIEENKSDITDMIDSQKVMFLKWFESHTREWQFGYSLVWLDDHWGYATTDNDAKLAVFVAASEIEEDDVLKISLKILKSEKVPLTETELTSLVAFWAKEKPAGLKMTFISIDPNPLNIQAVVVRDRNVLNEDNTLIRDASINPLQDALDAFTDSIEFDGKIRRTDIEAAAKTAEGIIDFYITFLWINQTAGVSWTQVDMEVIPASGFAYIDWDESDFTYIDE
ncbi:MAG: hypothetical protein PHU33_16455 [Bacteroidales bacterium]|nr:hypothetical protein [Bacteroidales bacterium]